MKSLLVASVCVFVLVTMSVSGLKAVTEYPVKPITCIIPMEAGADGDVIMRPLLQKASAILGRPIMIVNKPGGGHTIGLREVYKAKPDGYTIGTFAPPIVTNKLQGIFPYDHKDYTLIGGFYVMPPILVASKKTQRPFNTVQEAFSFAKSHPGQVSAAVTSVGGAWWIATMLLMEDMGLKFNVIPQAGAGALVIAQVAGGHADLTITGMPTAKGQIVAGNVQPLAIVGPQRYSGEYSNIPTLKEAGYNFSFEAFGGVIGPPGMPKEVTAKLVDVFRTAGTHPEYEKFVLGQDNFPLYQSPSRLLSFCEEKRKVFRSLFEKTGLLKEK